MMSTTSPPQPPPSRRYTNQLIDSSSSSITQKEQQELQEIRQLWKELGMTSSSSLRQSDNDDNGTTSAAMVARTFTTNSSNSFSTSNNFAWQNNPILTIGFGTALLFNIGILCSVPPVLRGRGAPYLPTYKTNIIQMFQQLRNEAHFMNQHRNVVAAAAAQVEARATTVNTTTHQQVGQPQPVTESIRHTNTKNKLIFVDLGSGDGRIVFHAAYKEQLFTHCIGYEINPFLHVLARIKQQWYYYWHYNRLSEWWTQKKNTVAQNHLTTTTTTPQRSTITQFYLRDLWKVDLQNVNVVAVYGLGPIMKELGKKLQTELPHGSYVLSNVFTFPGWKPLTSNNTSVANSSDSLNSTAAAARTYIYRIPDCYAS